MINKTNIKKKILDIIKSTPFKIGVGVFIAALALLGILQAAKQDNAGAVPYSVTTGNCLVENQAQFTSDQDLNPLYSSTLSNNITGCNTQPPQPIDCTIKNTAQVTGDSINVVVSNTTNNAVDCQQDYAIGIQKTPSSYLFEIDQNAPQNTSYTYYLDYGNTDPTPLTNVSISDTLDPRIEYIPSSCTGGISCSYNAGTRTLTYNIGSLAANQFGRAEFKVNFAQGHTFTVNETIPNTAIITSNEAGPDQDAAYVNIRYTNPDVNITKDVDKIYHNIGDQVLYTINYQNTKTTPLTGVYITDVLDSRLNFVSCSGSCTYTASTRTVRWNIGTLAVGGTGTRYLTLTPQSTGVINNKATIFTNETDPDFDDVNIIVQNSFESVIKIVKTASEDTVRRNDTYTYTLDYYNPSDDTPLTGVVITDVLTDTKIDFVPGTCTGPVTCSYNSATRTLTWNIGNLAVGQTGTVKYDVKVTPNAPLQTIYNEATIDSNETGPDTDADIVDIIAYDIYIQKTPSSYLFEINPTAPQNTSYTYYLDFGNSNATTSLTNVVITDTLDTRIEYVANSCTGGCSYNSATRTLTWTVGGLAPTQIGRYEYKVNFASNHTFVINESVPNTAFINSTEAGPDHDSAYVNVRFTNPDINITKDVDKVYHNIGDSVVYTIGYANTKTTPLTGVYITDILDSRLTYVSCTGGCTYDAATRTVRWEIGNLAVGATGTRYMTVSVAGTGVINNKATIFSNETQPDYDDVNIIVTTQEYEIKIIKRASENTVRRGDTYTYTLNYSNPSDDTPLTGVVITDVLTDTKIDFVPGTCGGTPTCTYDSATRTLTWAVGNMAVGATGQVTFDVKVKTNAALETITNTATIDSNETDPDQSTALVEIIDYAIYIEKTPSAYLFEINPTAPQNTSYTYYLDYGNTEATPLTNVVITDTLDPRITYVAGSCTASCSYNATTRTLTWNIGGLAANSTGRVQYNVNFTSGYTFTVNESVPNTAIIDSTETPPDQDSAYVNVRFTNPDINITKDTDQIYHNINDTVVYDIGFQNTAAQPLTGVYITDILDSRLNFVSCTGGCTYTAATRTVRWNIGSLAVGASAHRYLTVTVNGTGVINNKATIFSNETQPDYDDVNIIITTQEYVIKIIKRASETTVRRGDTYTYTLDYSNPSDDTPLTGVVITDVLSDPKIDFVPNSCSGTPTCSYNATTKTLTWTVGNMAVGATGQVKFDVKVKSDAALESILNTAVIDSNETGPDQDTAIVDIIDYAIYIEKTPSAYLFEIDPAHPENTSYTYYLDYGNLSAQPLTNAVITDTLDSRIEYVANLMYRKLYV